LGGSNSASLGSFRTGLGADFAIAEAGAATGGGLPGSCAKDGPRLAAKAMSSMRFMAIF
jgi:hypothetical protein